MVSTKPTPNRLYPTISLRDRNNPAIIKAKARAARRDNLVSCFLCLARNSMGITIKQVIAIVIIIAVFILIPIYLLRVLVFELTKINVKISPFLYFLIEQ